jgi:hypothetical protein
MGNSALPDHEAIHESWQLIIAELEADLARVQSGDIAGSRIVSADWSPPAIVGPLPDEYANYVRELIERQREAVTRLEEARRVTGGHIAAVRAASSSTGEAVYLDVEG